MYLDCCYKCIDTMKVQRPQVCDKAVLSYYKNSGDLLKSVHSYGRLTNLTCITNLQNIAYPVRAISVKMDCNKVLNSVVDLIIITFILTRVH